jgi:arylsulfatase A-like enzyme
MNRLHLHTDLAFINRMFPIPIFVIYAAVAAYERPNVILMMADDLGYGDVAYHGFNQDILTPNLDAMAANGLQFSRFYSASAVCSPTRASVMTGRNPMRMGIPTANSGHMPDEEITIGEAVKLIGYTTGHFGKWHLGTLTTTVTESNRGGPGSEAHYAPPWDHGFDVCFSTEAKTPTWDPMIRPTTFPSWGSSSYGWPDIAPDEPTVDYNTHYWDGPESMVTENLEGDDSRIIMDRAIPFIRQAVADDKSFLAVIWFHTPHLPVVSGGKYLDLYNNFADTKRWVYYGCITAMDEQIGRLRNELDSLGIKDKTMVWFTADNGPENNTPGITGGLRARKRSLYEGGIRVAGLLEWPEKVSEARVTDIPAFTSDYYPTILDALGFRIEEQTSPMDGISLMPLIEGTMTERTALMAFEFGNQDVMMGNEFKIYRSGTNAWQLYNIPEDRHEDNNLASSNTAMRDELVAAFTEWKNSETVYGDTCCTLVMTRKAGCTDSTYNEYDETAEISVDSLCKTLAVERRRQGPEHISASLWGNGKRNIRVFDVHGRMVHEFNARYENRRWNGNGAVPGVYVVRIVGIGTYTEVLIEE